MQLDAKSVGDDENIPEKVLFTKINFFNKFYNFTIFFNKFYMQKINLDIQLKLRIQRN